MTIGNELDAMFADIQRRLVAVEKPTPPPPPPPPPPPTTTLRPSGPINISSSGQVVENLDITADGVAAIKNTGAVRDITIRNCRIRHSQGSSVWASILLSGITGLRLENLEIIRTDTRYNLEHNNIGMENCPGAVLTRIRALRGSSNIYITGSPDLRMSFLELHDAKGPMARGQNLQLGNCPRAIIDEFSGENVAGALPYGSFTEDNFSFYGSPNTILKHGLVDYNNGPTGVGIMFEPGNSNSNNALVEDVDLIGQGNGVLSFIGATGCIARRVRARGGHLTTPERGGTSSGGLSFYSPGGANTFAECKYLNPAHPSNIVYAPGSSVDITPGTFTPRAPIRLVFPWAAS